MGHTQTGPWLTAGQQLKALRKRRGYSHDTLAAKVGSSRSYLIRLEKGLHRPKAGGELMLALNAALRADVESFYEVEAESDITDEEAAFIGDLMHAFIEARRGRRDRLARASA